MKIKRYDMEDWLNESREVAYDLSASGCQDFFLEEFLELCGTGIEELGNIFLGDNITAGSPELREEIGRCYDNVGLEDVLVSNGSSEAIFCFFNQLLNEGDEVVVPLPAFQCLHQVPVSIGCRIKGPNLLESKNWRLDVDDLDRYVTPATKLIVINNPHNPIGWTLSDSELRKIGEMAHRNDAFLLFDEHYRYLPLKNGTGLVSSGYDICKAIHPRTFATGSMIKCFGIVGIRIGWLIGDPRFLSLCRDYKDYLTHTIPHITDFIACLALRNRDKIINRKKQYIMENLESLNRFMNENRDIFEYMEPSGGVVCFPRFKPQPVSDQFCRILRSAYGVSILPGYAFGVKSHMRLNFGLDPQRFKEALALLQASLTDKCWVV